MSNRFISPRRVVSLLSMRRSSSDTNASSLVFTSTLVISLAALVRGMAGSPRTPLGHIRFLDYKKH
jgi:hypothetical protein